MELYILSKDDLSVQSITKASDYSINLDEETNAKTTFILEKCEGLKKENFIVVNGLYKQFLFIIDDVQSEKSSNIATITALDISNIFDRKVIEKDTETMTTNSIEEFIANTISENFVNSDDIYTNKSYIDIFWHTNTQAIVSTNAENGLYNFHTFLTNCRQSKNIYTDFKFINGRLRIDIECKNDIAKLIDTTVAEVTDYNEVYDTEVVAKVEVLVREDNSIYNLYLKNDRTTTEDKNDPDRAIGKIETISVDAADKAKEEALNVLKGNRYNHLVEFKIAKSSKLMDITQFYIGREVKIKTNDKIYNSYISAITLTDDNFVYFKSGNLRIDLLDKLKKKQEGQGNKLDCSGGKITGKLDVKELRVNGKSIAKSIITIALDDTYDCTVLDSYTKITGWSQKFKLGNKLSFSNNEIVICEGISKVMVSAKLGWYGVGSGIRYAYILKNSERIAWLTQDIPNNSYLADTIQNVPVEVSSGDKISVKYYTSHNGDSIQNAMRTYLTVEVIE